MENAERLEGFKIEENHVVLNGQRDIIEFMNVIDKKFGVWMQEEGKKGGKVEDFESWAD